MIGVALVRSVMELATVIVRAAVMLVWQMKLMGLSGLIMRAPDGGLFAGGRFGLNIWLNGLMLMEGLMELK